MLYHIYCDESRQTNYHYMVIGGVIVPANNVPNIEKNIQLIREEEHMFAELKWEKVTNQKLKEYKAFVNYFFSLIKMNEMQFHCVIIDNQLVNYNRYSSGNKEIGFYKFFYQLLIHCFGKHYCREGEDDRFIPIFHRRSTKYSLETLHTILNNGMKKICSITTRPFKNVQPIKAKDSNIIQLLDIIIGAVGYQKNDLHKRKNARKSKEFMTNFIANQAGLLNLKQNTSWGKIDFKIWNFRLNK